MICLNDAASLRLRRGEDSVNQGVFPLVETCTTEADSSVSSVAELPVGIRKERFTGDIDAIIERRFLRVRVVRAVF